MTDTVPNVIDHPSDVSEAVSPGCDVCAHLMSAHDATALRFCSATQNSALTRGCICAT